jgi:TatD DNase family protein
MTTWPSIDAHAHIEPRVRTEDLRALQAAIFTATRTGDEFTAASGRQDDLVAWGVGAHPGVNAAIAGFDVATFGAAAARAALISEVGLDGRSPVPLAIQTRVLREILAVAADAPRIVSIHSAGATARVLDLLADRCPPGVILHWWRGSAQETAQAVTLGCYFSVNHREIRRPRVLGAVPANRLLTETDHPFGDRGAGRPRPGGVASIERAIAETCGTTPEQTRRSLWGNLAALINSTDAGSRLPPALQELVLSAPAPLTNDYATRPTGSQRPTDARSCVRDEGA